MQSVPFDLKVRILHFLDFLEWSNVWKDAHLQQVAKKLCPWRYIQCILEHMKLKDLIYIPQYTVCELGKVCSMVLNGKEVQIQRLQESVHVIYMNEFNIKTSDASMRVCSHYLIFLSKRQIVMTYDYNDMTKPSDISYNGTITLTWPSLEYKVTRKYLHNMIEPVLAMIMHMIQGSPNDVFDLVKRYEAENV